MSGGGYRAMVFVQAVLAVVVAAACRAGSGGRAAARITPRRARSLR